MRPVEDTPRVQRGHAYLDVIAAEEIAVHELISTRSGAVPTLHIHPVEGIKQLGNFPLHLDRC